MARAQTLYAGLYKMRISKKSCGNPNCKSQISLRHHFCHGCFTKLPNLIKTRIMNARKLSDFTEIQLAQAEARAYLGGEK